MTEYIGKKQSSVVEIYINNGEKEFDIKAFSLSFVSLYFVESIHQIFPIFKLVLYDKELVLLNEIMLSGYDKFRIRIGKYGYDFTEYKNLIPYSIKEIENADTYTSLGVNYVLYLVPYYFNKFIKQRRIRKFNNKNKYCFIVNEILSSYNFKEIYIEDSKPLQNPRIIQPNLTDREMIDYISERAVNYKGISGYKFFVDRFNRAFFSTFNGLAFYEYKCNSSPIKKKVEWELYYNTEEFRKTSDEDHKKRIREGKDYIYNFKVKPYSKLYFSKQIYRIEDYNNYIEEFKTIKDVPIETLSNYRFITEDDIKYNYDYNYNNRKNELNQSYLNDITNLSSYRMKLEIGIDGFSEMEGRKYELGQLAKVYITLSKDNNAEFIDKLNGKYLISGIEHFISSKDYNYRMKLILEREGIDVKSKKGLIKGNKA